MANGERNLLNRDLPVRLEENPEKKLILLLCSILQGNCSIVLLFFGIPSSNSGRIMIFVEGILLKKLEGSCASGVSSDSSQQNQDISEADAAAFKLNVGKIKP
jgi:hypothetical protein